MNKSKIEWCDYTWNPITGCYHGCEYCYARRIAHRFGGYTVSGGYTRYTPFPGELCALDGPLFIARDDDKTYKAPYPYRFIPTFYKYRLDEPQKIKNPSKIFVSSMGDLFGEWVPEEWIKEVFKACHRAPQHTYMFLTKNPDRYYNYFADSKKPAPKNWWVGASASICNTAHTRSESLNFMNANTFLSLEPLHENVAKYIEWEGIDWLIIGAQTGSGAIKPKKEWVQRIIDQAREHKKPLFLKDNLGWPEKIQEWPEVIESSRGTDDDL